MTAFATCPYCGREFKIETQCVGFTGCSGLECPHCTRSLALYEDADPPGVWVYYEGDDSAPPKYDLQLRIERVRQHHDAAPPERDENVQEIVGTMNKLIGYGYAIHEAARDGKLETVKALLAAGDDVNRKTTEISGGETPLYLAVQQACIGKRVPRDRMVAVIRFLLAHGANPNVRDSAGGTALHTASAVDSEIVQILLSNGADHRIALYHNEWTPLHTASYNGNVESVRVLLLAGADSKAMSRDGEIPSALARRAQSGDGNAVRELLQESEESDRDASFLE